MNHQLYLGREGWNLCTAVHNRLISETELKVSEICDIGCGSSLYKGDFPPRLCRHLWRKGYKVLGVDALDNSSEEFPNQVIDVTQPEVLKQLGESRFQVVHENNFTHTSNICPSLKSKVRNWKDFLDQFQKEVLYILTENGIYIQGGVNSRFFRKSKGKLKKLTIA